MNIFIDLNSYFASVEQQANTFLRGKPVGVCEHSGGIILAASKEAKKLGIKTGTPTWQAKKICPNIVLLPVDPPKIRTLTSRFYRIAEDYSDQVEHVSVDEVSIRVEPCTYQQAVEISKEIKTRIKKEMGEWITCSVGVGENRLLAKIGSDLQKPDGLVVITEQRGINTRNNAELSQDVKVVNKHDLYSVLDLEDVPGIGSGLGSSLRAKGIGSLKQLSRVSRHALYSWYGVNGIWLYDLSRLRDAWKWVNLDERGLHSIGHQYSLQKRNALYKKEQVQGLLWKLTQKVTNRMRTQKVVGRAVHTQLKYVNGASVGGSRRVKDYFNDTPTVMKIVEKNLKDADYKRGVAYTSVTVSGLIEDKKQGILFEKYEKPRRISATLDKINSRFGGFTVKYGPTIEVDSLANDTVGFGRTRERKEWKEE